MYFDTMYFINEAWSNLLIKLTTPKQETIPRTSCAIKFWKWSTISRSSEIKTQGRLPPMICIPLLVLNTCHQCILQLDEGSSEELVSCGYMEVGDQ